MDREAQTEIQTINERFPERHQYASLGCMDLETGERSHLIKTVRDAIYDNDLHAMADIFLRAARETKTRLGLVTLIKKFVSVNNAAGV